jgi:hypothetical protein
LTEEDTQFYFQGGDVTERVGMTPGAVSRIVAYWVCHFADDVVQDPLGDGAEELVASSLLGMEIDAGQLGIVAQHALKVGWTTQYVWGSADGPAGAKAT